MRRSSLIALVRWTLLAVPFAAGAGPAAEPGPEQEAGVWSQARDAASDWWQGSQSTAGQIWQNTRRLVSADDTGHFRQVWEEVLPKLETTLSLQEQQAELPASAWWGPDQRSNEREINALLDEAVTILSTSEAAGYRERMRRLRAAIEAAQGDIAEDRQRRVSAPSESLVEKTVEDFDRAIAERQADIERYVHELATVKQEFAAEMRRIGLDLDDEQLELLLSTVIGDNLVDLGVVFDNVKAVTAQLEGLVEDSGEDLTSARRYYGMYVILLKSLQRMHLQIEQTIAQTYLPEIDAIIERARSLSAETRALQRQSSDKSALLAQNLEAQELTVRAADAYRQYLTDQARQVAQARRELERDIAAAWNTYETVRVSGELVGLVRASRQLLDGLLERQVPPLRPFQNLEMKREFEKLTHQLRRD